MHTYLIINTHALFSLLELRYDRCSCTFLVSVTTFSLFGWPTLERSPGRVRSAFFTERRMGMENIFFLSKVIFVTERNNDNNNNDDEDNCYYCFSY